MENMLYILFSSVYCKQAASHELFQIPKHVKEFYIHKVLSYCLFHRTILFCQAFCWRKFSVQ